MPDGLIPSAAAAVKPRVRIATSADVEPLFDLLYGPQGLYKNSAEGLGAPASADKVRAFVTAACAGNGGIAGVVDGINQIVGSIGIFLWQPWWSEVWMLSEHWVYVRPQFRGVGFDDALFRFAEEHRADMAQRLDRPDLKLQMSVASMDRLPAKMRLWRRHGDQNGAMFVMPKRSRS